MFSFNLGRGLTEQILGLLAAYQTDNAGERGHRAGQTFSWGFWVRNWRPWPTPLCEWHWQSDDWFTFKSWPSSAQQWHRMYLMVRIKKPQKSQYSNGLTSKSWGQLLYHRHQSISPHDKGGTKVLRKRKRLCWRFQNFGDCGDLNVADPGPNYNNLGFPRPPLSLFEYEATSLRQLGGSLRIYEWTLVPTIRWHLNHIAEFSASCCDLPTRYYSNVLKAMLVCDFLCSMTIQTSWDCFHIGVENLFLDHGHLILVPEKKKLMYCSIWGESSVSCINQAQKECISQHNQGYTSYIHTNIIKKMRKTPWVRTKTRNKTRIHFLFLFSLHVYLRINRQWNVILWVYMGYQ